MKCPICGKQTLPGAKLCSPCRAALKRAKDDSVWVMPPGAGAARPAATGGEAEAEAGVTRSAGGTRLGGWRGVGVGIAALFVAAGVLATVRLVQVDGPAPVERTAAAPEQPIAAPASSAPEVLDLSVVAQRPAAPVVTPALDAEPAPARPRERAPRSRPVVEPPPPPPPVVEAPPPEPAPPPVIERPVPTKPVDPWQRMSESLVRCAGQELFARLGCEHRVRATYCDGNWGRVPQCPGGLPTDHGQ